MIYLSDDLVFPDVSTAMDDGLLAIGGDLSAARLLLAYRKGIFPWYNFGEPILWWSPDPRFVLFPNKLKVSKSMKPLLKKQSFKVTVNTSFEAVIRKCAIKKRRGQSGTWITEDMIQAYITLHHLGYATSVEVWDQNHLVGGLYGIDLKNGVFCGESMFSEVSNASKVGFITFIQIYDFRLIDCQLHTSHLESLGAEDIDRKRFISYLG